VGSANQSDGAFEFAKPAFSPSTNRLRRVIDGWSRLEGKRGIFQRSLANASFFVCVGVTTDERFMLRRCLPSPAGRFRTTRLRTHDTEPFIHIIPGQQPTLSEEIIKQRE